MIPFYFVLKGFVVLGLAQGVVAEKRLELLRRSFRELQLSLFDLLLDDSDFHRLLMEELADGHKVLDRRVVVGRD